MAWNFSDANCYIIKNRVWAYVDADGVVAEPASKKGASCISCHTQTDNIDYMLMNKYFP